MNFSRTLVIFKLFRLRQIMKLRRNSYGRACSTLGERKKVDMMAERNLEEEGEEEEAEEEGEGEGEDSVETSVIFMFGRYYG